jgi:ATP-dependent helicase HrpB
MIGAGEDTGEPSAEIVGILLASAYPDRVARQREPGGARYLLANGRGAVLADQSVVRNESFIVAVNVAAGEGAEDRIRLASALSLAGVRHLFASSITRSRVVGWDEREGRVVSREEERLDQLLLETRFVAPTREEARDALIAGISAGSAGLSALKWTPQVIQFVARIRFLRRTFPGEWPDFPDENLLATLGEWLGPYLDNVKNLADLGKIDVTAPLHDLLTRENRRKLEAGAPQHIVVPSGSQIRIDYLPEDGPILAVKLQELFGLDDTPTVAWGRVQLVLHLLSPAGRPVQVTRDLKNFWNHGYPVVKRELKGRYPKHPWPDDPWSAVPTKFTGRKAQR